MQGPGQAEFPDLLRVQGLAAGTSFPWAAISAAWTGSGPISATSGYGLPAFYLEWMYPYPFARMGMRSGGSLTSDFKYCGAVGCCEQAGLT